MATIHQFGLAPALPYASWAGQQCQAWLKEAARATDKIVVAYGDSIGGACFASMIALLKFAENKPLPPILDATMSLWLATTSACFMLPLASRKWPHSPLFRKLADQDTIHIASSALYVACAGTYCFVGMSINPATAIPAGATATGNIINLVNKVALPHERLKGLFKKVARFSEKKAEQSTLNTKLTLNYLAACSRYGSGVLLFGHDWYHTAAGILVMVGLTSIQYRNDRLIRRAVQKNPTPS